VWKTVEDVSRHLVTDAWRVNPIFQVVNFRALLGGLERFTSFLIMNILKKWLSSTKTIAKLVEKPVQISV
jgi:kynureninase